MPSQSRPGVAFGGESRYCPPPPAPVGSLQRWHAVTRLASGVPLVGAAAPAPLPKNARVKLTPQQQADLKNAMLAALGVHGITAVAPKPTGQVTTTHWGNVAVARGAQKAAPLSAAAAIAMAKGIQAAEMKAMMQKGLSAWSSSSQPGNTPSGSGPSGISANVDLNVSTPSIPQPSGSANFSFGT